MLGGIVLHGGRVLIPVEDSQTKANHLLLQYDFPHRIRIAMLNLCIVDWCSPKLLGELVAAWRMQVLLNRDQALWISL